MKWLEDVAAENNSVKRQLSQIAEENVSLRLEVQRSLKASTSILFQINHPDLQHLLGATRASRQTHLRHVETAVGMYLFFCVIAAHTYL